MNENVCCFTGHRSIPVLKNFILKARVARLINRLADEGVDTFICGGAVGFDALCGLEVLKIRKKKKIKLIMACPCKNQNKFFSAKASHIYKKLLSNADETIYLSENYHSGCMHERNKYMVNKSSILISYCHKSLGGSYYTKKYAMQRGLKIFNI